MNSFLEEISGLPAILLKIDHIGSISGVDGSNARLPLKGGIVLRTKNIEDSHSDLGLLRLGLVGHDDGEMGAGEISVAGISGSGTLQAADENVTTISLNFSAYVLTDAVISAEGYPYRRNDLWLSPWEEWDGSISGAIEAIEAVQSDTAQPSSWHLGSGTLQLRPRENSRSSALIREISVSLADAVVYPARLPPPNCPAGYAADKRTLFIRPVFFELATGVTGGSLADQLAKAAEIWGRCCIEFKPLAPITITKKEIKEKGLMSAIVSGDVEKIAGIYSDAVGIVEVFFVKNTLASSGGGVTLNGGMSQTKIVITDQHKGNLQLLAHEFGHSFKGDHPSSKDPLFWPGDNGTVLKPDHPNPEKNTLNNCQSATNPALVSDKPPVSCCINPGGGSKRKPASRRGSLKVVR